MPDGKLILIAGRSTQQGTGLNVGKDSEGYQEAVTTLEISPADMAKFGLRDGDMVKLKTPYGEATVKCRGQELPEGLAFIAYGPASSRLMGGETHASGMPSSKGFEVELERIGS